LYRIEVDLPQFPYRGRKIGPRGIRELPIPNLPYVVVYRVDEARELTLIDAIMHGARDR
jgi:hypothetical protein